MKTRSIICPKCATRMKRKYGYKKAFWKCHVYGYRTVYVCKCGERVAIVTMDEDGYNAYIKELADDYLSAQNMVSTLTMKLNGYREKTNTFRLKVQLDELERQIKRLKDRLGDM